VEIELITWRPHYLSTSKLLPCCIHLGIHLICPVCDQLYVKTKSIDSLANSLTYWFIVSLTHWFIASTTHLMTDWLTAWLTYRLTHSFWRTVWFTHNLNYISGYLSTSCWHQLANGLYQRHTFLQSSIIKLTTDTTTTNAGTTTTTTTTTTSTKIIIIIIITQLLLLFLPLLLLLLL